MERATACQGRYRGPIGSQAVDLGTAQKPFVRSFCANFPFHHVNIITLYDKLEKLVARLPQPLQSPILREVRPIKTLFLHQRAPRILLLGDRAASRSELINAL